jgi:hypothetical protein
MCAETLVPFATAQIIRIEPQAEFPPAVGVFHAAYAGASSPLHFDWDLRWVCHVNLVGKKRLWCFPPNRGRWWPTIFNMTLFPFGSWSEDARRAFAAEFGGMEFALGPGDAVCFPPLWWHAAVYERPSLSISLRFERWPELRPFAAFPQASTLQRVIWELIAQERIRECSDLLFEALVAFLKTARSPAERRTRMVELWQAYEQHLCGVSGAEAFLPSGRSLEERYLPHEVVDLYGLCARKPSRQVSLGPEVLNYMFPTGESANLPKRMRSSFVHYALDKRRGLPPKRGFVGTSTTELGV